METKILPASIKFSGVTALASPTRDSAIAKATYTFEGQALKVGDARFVVQITSDANTDPLQLEQAVPVARVAFVAARGPCWLDVHVGSPTAPAVYFRTLDQGQAARFVSKRIWIRIGAPWNVDATLNGRKLALPATTASVVVTARGLRTS